MNRVHLAGRLPCLKEGDAEELSFRFRNPSQVATAAEMSTLLGVTVPQGLAILAEVAGEARGELVYIVFHDCDADTPAGFWRVCDGIPAIPWRCELCDDAVEGEDELTVTMGLYVPDPIEFTWGRDEP